MATKNQHEQFVALLTGSQRRLFVTIARFLSHPQDVDEVLQRVNAVLLEKEGEFTPGTDFLAWARQVARYEVLAYRSAHGRERLQFSSDVVNIIAAENYDDQRSEERRVALADCLQKLRDDDQRLIARRYDEDRSVKQIAEELSRPLKSIYRSLDRIRSSLLDCIQRSLAEKECRH